MFHKNRLNVFHKINRLGGTGGVRRPQQAADKQRQKIIKLHRRKLSGRRFRKEIQAMPSRFPVLGITLLF
jgi:hypothetical protein